MDTKLHVNRFLDLIVGDRNPVTAPARHIKIPQTIAHRWHLWGLSTNLISVRQDAFVGFNLWSPPPRPDEPYVLLMAHHDTVPNCPGLDDNGSGMAVIDAIAKMHVNDGKKLNLAFCMPDFEEGDPRVWDIVKDLTPDQLTDPDIYWDAIYEKLPDVTGFLGARSLYKRLDERGLLEGLDAVFNFDTVGYRSEEQQVPPRVPGFIAKKAEKGDFVGVVGNWKARKWMKAIKRESRQKEFKTVRLTVPGKGKLIPDTRRSDHAVFWSRKKPAVFFTDTANFRNPNYHRSTDLVVDSGFIAQTAEFVYELLKKEHL